MEKYLAQQVSKRQDNLLDWSFVSRGQGTVRVEDCNGRQPVAEPLGIITIEDVIEELLQQVRPSSN